MIEDIKLKPCPKCGGTPTGEVGYSEVNIFSGPIYRLRCCGIKTHPHKNPNDTDKEWNRLVDEYLEREAEVNNFKSYRCPKCGKVPELVHEIINDGESLYSKYMMSCCDISIHGWSEREAILSWARYVVSYQAEEGNQNNSTNYDNVNKTLTTTDKGEDNMKDNEPKFSQKRCKYCGGNLKEEFTYDDRTCSTVYSCDCEGAKEQKRLEEAIKGAKQRVEDLEHALQQHKASSLYTKQYNDIMNEMYNLEHTYHDIGKIENEVVAV